MEERLQKYISECGICSRRKAEEFIQDGKVYVNGKVAKLGDKINPSKDMVTVNGKTIRNNEKKVYILLNKPIGYVTTVKDQFDRDTVMDLIKDVKERVVPVGRLDMYTSGALLLSNDGDFINKITHPSNEINKTYNVTISGKIVENDVEKLRDGVIIDENGKDYKTKPAKVKILKIDEEKNQSRIQITIHEGKNREVRKMCESIGKKVLALHRVSIGKINVKDIPIGKYKFLNKKEIEGLYK